MAMFHVFNLYETTTKIPLLVHYPSLFAPGAKDERLVQLTDVFPTILAITGVPPGPKAVQGYDLLGNGIPDDRSVICEYYYPNQAFIAFGEKNRNHPRLQPFKRRLRSVLSHGMKFIAGSDGKHELYDLANDPHERANLIDQPHHVETAQRLQSLLDSDIAQYGKDRTILVPQQEEPLDNATKEQLRLLGYLES
jgi:arylsulfatase A-like enzyme